MSCDGLTADSGQHSSEKLLVSAQDRKEILPDQLRYLYKSSIPNIIGNLVCAVAVSLLCWGFSHEVYTSEIYWFTALLCVVVLRCVLYSRFRKADLSVNPQKWLYALALIIGLFAAIWGASIIFALNRGSDDSVLTLLIATMTGIIAVTTLSYGVHRVVFWSYLIPFILVFDFGLLQLDDEKYVTFVIGVTGYVLVMGYMGHLVENIVNRNFILGGKNQRLHDELFDVSFENKQSYSNLRSFLDCLGSGVAMFDENLCLLVWNHAYKSIFEFEENFLKTGMPIQKIMKTYFLESGVAEEEVEEKAGARLEEILDAANSPDSRLDFKALDGRSYEIKVMSLENKNTLLNFMDVTQREKARTEDIIQVTQQDALTGLPNRMMFRNHLKKILRSEDPSEYGMISVVHLGIDLFKDINDNYGHPFGDRVLQHLAAGLRGYLKDQDFLARFSGDEFAIIFVRHHDMDDVITMVEQMVQYIRQPIGVMGRLVKIDASVGLTIYPEQEGDADKLISNADIALNKAKAVRGKIVVYESSMHSEIMQRASLISDLRDNMETSQFVLHYQPQIDVVTRQVCGMEALMRWNHPEKGWISPAEFIPLAELSRQIIPLTEQLLPEACIQAKLWEAQGLPPMTVSVNISPLHFQEEGFVDFVRTCLDEAELEPHMLELEITEGIVMSQTDQVMNTLQELADAGIHLSIDDFGTGYSSLSYLRTLPVEKLKIDQCFIVGMEDDPGAQSIVAAIVRLGHSFNLKVIAEGVETAAQLEKLGVIGCDQAQGYYISRPVTADNITTWVKEHHVA